MRIRILPLAIVATTLLSAIHAARADNLVQNGDFASGLTGWTFYTDKETAKGTHEAAGGVFKLTAPDAGAQPHVRQLLQPVRVEPGKRYEMSFEARNDGGQAAEMVIVLGPKVEPGQPAEHYGVWRKVPMSKDWTPQKFTFTAKDGTDPAKAILKINMGFLAGVTELRNIKLVPLP